MPKNTGLLALFVMALLLLAYLQLSPSPQSDKSRDKGPVKEQLGTKIDDDRFDFYVLALSWSPSFCINDARNNSQQCGKDKDFGFVVHGLWPQHDKGYPEFCSSSEPERVPNQLGQKMLDIMPSMGLIGHQWRKHGSCTGLSQRAYFDLTRKAYDQINIPAVFETVNVRQSMSPKAIETAFIKENAGLRANQIAVTCSSGLVEEVRICLTKDLNFRSCPEVDQKSCRAGNIQVPPQ